MNQHQKNTELINFFKNIKACIVDFDGTIWEHRKDEVKLFCQNLGIAYSPILDKQFHEMLNGFSDFLSEKVVTKELVTTYLGIAIPILKDYGVSGKRFLDSWLQVNTSLIIEPALKLIKILYANKVRIIGLSDFFLESQIRQLKEYGYLPYFSEIYCFDGKSYLKSDPRTVSKVMKDLNPSHTVMIGDSLSSDIGFACKAKTFSILISENPDLGKSELQPTYVVPNILTITNAVLEM